MENAQHSGAEDGQRRRANATKYYWAHSTTKTQNVTKDICGNNNARETDARAPPRSRSDIGQSIPWQTTRIQEDCFDGKSRDGNHKVN